LFHTISQTEEAYFQLFSISVILQCYNYHAQQIKGTQNTPAFYDSNKRKAQLLGLWLKQWNLLEEDVLVSICGKRQSDTVVCDSLEGDRLYCNNIQKLMEDLQFDHTSEQWIYLKSI
jgi:hypothetical protein